MINWVSQLTDEDLEHYQYRLSDPAKEVPLMSFATSVKATRSIANYYEKEIYGESYEELN